MAYDSAYVDAVMGCLVQERNMDIIANNLANATTAGFKGDRLIFNDIMTREIQTNYNQGSMQHTGNPLDVAIVGKGFLQVQTANGIRLTRNGSLHLSAEGVLVDASGNPVLGEGGQGITLNPNGPPASIGADGTITQGTETVGKLSVVDVTDRGLLLKEGANLFTGRDGQLPPVTPVEGSGVEQGYLETTNIEVAREMVNMIQTYRAFESYQKIIHSLQAIDTSCINRVGRTS